MIAWLTARLGTAGFAVLAFVCAAGCLWQTARIEGWPLTGGGLKAQVARLEGQIAAAELARVKTEAAMLAAQARRAEAANEQARAFEEAKRANAEQFRKLMRKVPVDAKGARDVVCRLSGCVLSVGAVRLLDAAASGADPDRVAALVAPGQPDDAASDATLLEAVTVLAGNYARARSNAEQLRRLEASISGSGGPSATTRPGR